MKKALIIGGGGREHALVDALVSSPSSPRVICAPGNAGIAEQAEVVDLQGAGIGAFADLAADRRVDLVVVGPEAPLVAGLADALRARGIPVLGPGRAAAALEGSKSFAKARMDEAGVPTARWGSFSDPEAAVRFARALEGGAVVKADGLAAGKGVVVAGGIADAEAALREVLSGRFGAAGRTVVVEERLEGEELSVIGLSDGERLALLAPSQDHKRLEDGDRGPNTGGMGAYSPVLQVPSSLVQEIADTCMLPIIQLMADRGTPFSGVLYAGVMLTANGPRVLEYNVRLGDPEAQVILPRLEEDAFELFMAAATGALAPRPVRFSDRAAACVVIAAEGYPAKPRGGDAVEGLLDAAAVEDVRIYHAGTRREGDRVLTSGGRVLGVTGIGDGLGSAISSAYRAAGCIHFPGMQLRRDIGRRAFGA